MTIRDRVNQAVSWLEGGGCGNPMLAVELTAIIRGLEQALVHCEDVRLPHAQKQAHADGFQTGWHAALKRIVEGDLAYDLMDLVPNPPLPAPPGSGDGPRLEQVRAPDGSWTVVCRTCGFEVSHRTSRCQYGSGDGPPQESEAHAFARAVRDHLAELGSDEIGPLNAGNRHLLMVVGYARQLSDAVLAGAGAVPPPEEPKLRTLFEIIEAAKDNAPTTHEECLYALLAYSGLSHFDSSALRKLAFEPSKFRTPEGEAEESHRRWKAALNKSPKEWLGPNNDPENPECQRFRAMAEKIFDKVSQEVPTSQTHAGGVPPEPPQ